MIRITDGRYVRKIYGVPVVADIFRCTTNIVAMFMRGAEEIVPVQDKKEAFQMREKGYLLLGEEDGGNIEGFDYGNSPSETSELDLKGRRVAMKSTNGTDLILKVGEGAMIGSFLNISSLSRQLRNKEVHIFPANTKNGVATEDNEFSYALSKKVLEPGSDIKINVQKARNGNGALRLKDIGFEQDIEYSLQVDITEIVPVFREGKIVKIT